MNDISTQNWTPPVFEIDGCDTLPKLFRQNCRKFGSAIAIRERDFGIWEEYTWTDYYHRSRQAGCALMALGVDAGDVLRELIVAQRLVVHELVSTQHRRSTGTGPWEDTL